MSLTNGLRPGFELTGRVSRATISPDHYIIAVVCGDWSVGVRTVGSSLPALRSIASHRAWRDGRIWRMIGELQTGNANPNLAFVPKRLAIAAWVTPSLSLQPVQAVGVWLSSTNRMP